MNLIKLLFSLTNILIINFEVNKSFAMSFTAQYDTLKSGVSLTAMPTQVGVYTAAASIQINQPKPKHIESLQTILLNVTVSTSYISLKWKFWVITRTKRKRSSDANVVPEKRSLEWVIKVRQYGTLNVNVHHVRDDGNSIDDLFVHNKTYNYTIKGLKPLTAYELCIHSKHHTISDNIDSVINSRQSITQFNKNYYICKEIVTPSAVVDSVADLAIASAISSASTTVIIVVVFCCCRKSKHKNSETSIADRRVKYKKNIRYQRIWKWLDKSDKSAPKSCLTSSTILDNSKLHVNQAVIPIESQNHNYVTYINPNDIKCITGRKLRIFSKTPKQLHYLSPKLRDNITMTSMFRKRYARPNSWPQIDTKRYSQKSYSSPSILGQQNSNLWFHSMSPTVKLIKSLPNVDFV